MQKRADGRRVAREEGYQERPTAPAAAELPSPAELTEQAEAQELLMRCLLEIDEEQRAIVMLRYSEELSSKEIGKRLGLPAGTVRWKLKQGVDELRERLDERFDGKRGAWCLALAPLAKPSEVQAALAASGSLAILVGIMSSKSILGGTFLLLLTLGLGELLTGTGLRLPFMDAPRIPVDFVPIETGANGNGSNDRSELVASGDAEAIRSANRSREATIAAGEEGMAAPAPSHRMRFITEAAQPIEGVLVRSRYGSKDARWKSARDGSIEIALASAALAIGYRLLFSRLGYASDEFSLDGGELSRTIDLGDIVLHAGGELHGTVVDENNVPLAGASVRIAGREQRSSAGGGMQRVRETSLGAAEGVTDSGGHFLLRGLLVGDVRVIAETEDELHQGESGPIEIRAGQQSRGAIVVAASIPEGERIEGVVLDPSGVPVPRAKIRARYKTMWRGGSLGESANADGRFRLITVADTEHTLTATDPRRRWSAVVAKGVKGGELGLVLQFRAAEMLTLRLEDEAGQAVEVAACGTRVVGVEAGGEMLAEGGVPAGKAELLMPSDRFVVIVNAPGYASFEAGPFGVDDQALTAPVLCTLHSLPGIRGRVEAAGQTLAGARVILHLQARSRTHHCDSPVTVDPQPVCAAVTDAEGLFNLTVRKAGDYVLRVESAGFAAGELRSLKIDPESGLDGLIVELTPGGILEGRLPADGGARRSQVVAISRGDAHPFSQRVAPGERFRFEGLTPGPWFVTLIDELLEDGTSWSDTDMGSAYVIVPGNCDVREGAVTTYAFQDAPEIVCELSGTVHMGVEDAGTATTEWMVTLTQIEGGERTRIATQLASCALVGGRFSVVTHQPDGYQLLLSGEQQNGMRFMDQVDLGPGSNHWEFEQSCAVLDFSATADLLATGPYALVWKGRGKLVGVALLTPELVEGGQLTCVPAGQLSLRRLDGSGLFDPEQWPITKTFQLVAGEPWHIELP